MGLGDEVQTSLMKGKTMWSVELKSIQKLLKNTAKTAKSASLWDEPEETPAPPPEALLAPLPPPQLQSEHTGYAPEVPQQPP